MSDSHYKWSLLNVADMIHAHVSCSGESLRAEAEAELAPWLCMRVATWLPSRCPAVERYDNAVKALCEAALAEYDAK